MIQMLIAIHYPVELGKLKECHTRQK